MSGHTPRPWRSTYNAEEDREGLHRIRGANHHLVARGLTFEDAELIVHRVNTYDEILEILRETLDAFERLMNEANIGASVLTAETIRKMNEVPIKAQRVIAKAEGRHDA